MSIAPKLPRLLPHLLVIGAACFLAPPPASAQTYTHRLRSSIARQRNPFITRPYTDYRWGYHGYLGRGITRPHTAPLSPLYTYGRSYHSASVYGGYRASHGVSYGYRRGHGYGHRAGYAGWPGYSYGAYSSERYSFSYSQGGYGGYGGHIGSYYRGYRPVLGFVVHGNRAYLSPATPYQSPHRPVRHVPWRQLMEAQLAAAEEAEETAGLPRFPDLLRQERGEGSDHRDDGRGDAADEPLSPPSEESGASEGAKGSPDSAPGPSPDPVAPTADGDGRFLSGNASGSSADRDGRRGEP